MKRTLAILLVGLVFVLLSTPTLAATSTGSTWLKNPFLRLWNAIHGLQNQITGMVVNSGDPGPQGETGPEGPPGPQGLPGECSCVLSAADFQSLVARVEQLEQSKAEEMLPDCLVDSDCDDNNACTDDACDPEVGCVYSDNPLCDGETGGGTGESNNEGELIITEIMYNPDAVSDTAGEWVEIYNAGDSAVNINGWSIADYGSDNYMFLEDLIIQPNEYAVLCKNTDSIANGGVVCDAGYASFTLGNTADEVVLLRPDDSLSDEVLYDAAIEPWKSLNNPGYSLQLDPTHYNSVDNDYGDSWCNAIEPLDGGDYATPGGINSECGAG